MATIKFPTENKLKKTKKEEIIKFLKEEVEPSYTDLAIDAILVTEDSYTELEDELAVLKAENQAYMKESSQLKKDKQDLEEKLKNLNHFYNGERTERQAQRDKANSLEYSVICLQGSNFATKVRVLFGRNGIVKYFS